MKKLIMIVYGILAVLMLLGLFVDYPLTSSLYNENSPFGLFMAWFIYIPTFLIGYLSIFIILRPLIQSKIAYKYLTLGLFLLLYILLTIVFINVFTYFNTWIMVIILLLMNIAGLGITWSIPKERLFVYQKLALLYILVLVSEFTVVSSIKFLWGRERYYALDSVNDFSLWFIPQGLSKGSAYTSFPSGHTSAAAMSMIFLFVPLMIDSLKKYIIPIYIGVGAYVSLGALSRILLGKHYLSDTVFSVMIVLSLFLYFYKKINPNIIE